MQQNGNALHFDPTQAAYATDEVVTDNSDDSTPRSISGV
jgi:hypothetical protein